jgi:uncharacterized protein with NAD-binding domain and iron-sulfur cluster
MKPISVAIVGGGCAGIAAAFELSRPEHRGRFQVTVYQRGHRLGGKGASGRGVHGRIEEHGLHLWMGYYENAFGMMRACYDELARDPARHSIASFSDAFVPANFVAVADVTPAGAWSTWNVHFPASPGLPGDSRDVRPLPTLADYVSRLLKLAYELIASSWSQRASDRAVSPSPASGDTAQALLQAQNLLGLGVISGLAALHEVLHFLESALRTLLPIPDAMLLSLLEMARTAAQSSLDKNLAEQPSLRRVWAVLEIVFATVRGTIRHRLLAHPRGLEALDDYDCREWLLENGASRSAIDSAFVRALYDLAFAYEDGDSNRPRMAAGAGMRGFLRSFFTYRGAFFWKMTAGMGDVVFAPMYEVLVRRGVRFEFFHRLERVELASDDAPSHVAALHFAQQATPLGPSYQPLLEVERLPCFPAQPDYGQLVNGAALRAEGRDFEWHADARCDRRRRLEVGRDFDLVVLATGIDALPHCAAELVAHNERWRAMIEHVKSVPTQAFQIWLSSDMRELGWNAGPVNLCGFVEPFDTWADMTHLLPAESWPPGNARALAYFCSVMPVDADAHDREVARAVVRQAAVRFLNRDLAKLWPRCADRNGFRWDLLAVPSEQAGLIGEARFDAQFWSANTDPSERYTLSLPGSIKYRISPLDRSFDNLTIAGDWTDCGLNLGCVEAAVMSGRLAAHALAGQPLLSDIVGYDHP